MTEYIVLVLEMSDGAFRGYLALCNKTVDLNTNFANPSYLIQNLIFPLHNSILIWDSPLLLKLYKIFNILFIYLKTN